MKRHIPTPKILSTLKNKKKEAPKKRKLFILLTRFPNNSSVFLEFVTGFHYTHASIGLEEDRNIFYSFVLKGFIVIRNGFTSYKLLKGRNCFFRIELNGVTVGFFLFYGFKRNCTDQNYCNKYGKNT